MSERICLDQSEIGSLPFVQLPWIVLADNSLKHGAKMVYAALLSFFFQKSLCYPKVDTIASLTNLSHRRVQEHLVQLEKHGLIRREIVPGKATVYHRDEHLDLYTKGGGVLSDRAMRILEESGATEKLERINGERKMRESLGTSKSSDKSLDAGETEAEKGTEEVQEAPPEPSQSGTLPESRVRSLEEATAMAKSTVKKTEDAHKKRQERKNKRSQMAPDPEVEQAKQARKQERAEGRAQRGSALTVKDVEGEWRLAMEKKWPSVVNLRRAWGPPEYGMCKRLCETHGYDIVIAAVTAIISDWEDFMDRYGIQGYPTLKVIVAYADSWIPEATGGKIEPQTAKDKSMAMGEYDGTRGTKKGGISYFR